LFGDDVYRIIGAAMEVSSQLGSGYLEAVYQDALAFEFTSKNIPFIQQKDVPVHYKG
jgi:GxxExxY protein